MNQIIIHIGLSRTGTTTIQKHALKHCKKCYVFTKIPFTSKGKFTNGGGSPQGDSREIKELLGSISSLNSEQTRRDISNALTILSLGASNMNTKHKEAVSRMLDQVLQKICTISDKTIYISNERYSENTATLNGNSTHTNDTCFSIIALLSSLSRLGITPLVTVCMREPLTYLRSKYLRTVVQRQNLRLRAISVEEYIQKQATLENNHPGTSVLTHAMHSSFIKQLKNHTTVKAFGFQDLLTTNDIFSLMGLKGEGKYSFNDFPRENMLPCTELQKQAIDREITRALKKQNFYDRIKESQIFK